MGMRREDGGNGKNPRCRSTEPVEMRMRIHIKICLMFGVQTLDSFGEGPTEEGVGTSGIWGDLGFWGFAVLKKTLDT